MILSRLKWTWPLCVLTYIIFILVGISIAVFYASLDLLLVATILGIVIGGVYPSLFTFLHYWSTTIDITGGKKDSDGPIRLDCHRDPCDKWSPPQIWVVPILMQKIDLTYIKFDLVESLLPVLPQFPQVPQPHEFEKDTPQEIIKLKIEETKQQIKELEDGYREDQEHFNDNINELFRTCSTLWCYVRRHMSVMGPIPVEFQGKHYPLSYAFLLAPTGYTGFSKYRDHQWYGRFYYTDVIQYFMGCVDTNYGEIPVFFEVPFTLRDYEDPLNFHSKVIDMTLNLYLAINKMQPDIESLGLIKQKHALTQQMLISSEKRNDLLRKEAEEHIINTDSKKPPKYLINTKLISERTVDQAFIDSQERVSETVKKPSFWSRLKFWKRFRKKKGT